MVATVPSLASTEALPPGARPHYLETSLLRINAYLDWARLLRTSRILLALVMATNAALVAALIWQAGRSRVVPWVVEVDRAGAAVAMGPADRPAEPTRAMVVYALQLFFRSARTVTPDEALQRRLILDAYAYAGGAAVGELNDFFRRRSPFVRAERERVSPRVTSVLALDPEETAWRVQWEEAVHSPAGAALRTEQWQAVATIEIEPPEAPEEVLTNPAGIRVVRFDWTRLPES